MTTASVRLGAGEGLTGVGIGCHGCCLVVFEIHSGYTKQWLTAQSSKAKSEREAECKNRRYHTYVSHWDQIKVKTLVKRYVGSFDII